MFDHNLIGMQVCQSLRKVQQSGLLAPDVKVIPSRAVVRACLIEKRLTDVCGFDLRAMNAYRWHPTADALDTGSGHHVLSEATGCCDIDIRKWLTDEANNAVHDIDFTVTGNGIWNGVAVWFDLEFGEGLTMSSAECGSIRTALCFVDEQHVSAGDIVRVHVALQAGQLVFQGDTSPPRPRHAIVPAWHFDMLNDHARTEAYNKAITRAVARQRVTSSQVHARGH